MNEALPKSHPQHVALALESLKSASRIGLYGGSFDPVHIGHLILAREAMERLALSAIVFIPARISPHKEHTAPAAPKDRLEMVIAAIEGEQGFLFDDLEIEREGVSFTIDTVRQYRERLPQTEIYYLVGGDNLAALHTWKDIAELQQLVTFVVLERGKSWEVPEGSEFVARHISISSTEIRNRIASGLSIRYLVPDMVLEMIRTRKLYAC